MARIADIDMAIWDDSDFLDLTPFARTVYIWSFTNQRCPVSGLYQAPRPAMQLETGCSREQLDAALSELEAARFLFYDGKVLFVRTRVKRLRMKTKNMAKSIAGDLKRFSGHRFVDLFTEQNADQHWLWGYLDEGLDEPSIGTLPDPTQTIGGVLQDPQVKVQVKVKEGGVGETRRRKPQPPNPDAYPTDLAERLRPAAEAVVAVLQRVGDAKGAKTITKAAVGRALASFPNHDHVKVANDIEHYWVHGAGASKPVRDVVLTFRNRLDSLPAPIRPATAAATTPAAAADDYVANINAAQARLKAQIPPREDVPA